MAGDGDNSIICPRCERTKPHVIDTRSARGMIRRRRHCGHCDFRFWTVERIDLNVHPGRAKGSRKIIEAMSEVEQRMIDAMQAGL